VHLPTLKHHCLARVALGLDVVPLERGNGLRQRLNVRSGRVQGVGFDGFEQPVLDILIHRLWLARFA